MTATKRSYIHEPVAIAPLVTFRIVFGLLLFISLLRFWWRGWITDVYVTPSFHFTYWGFEWVQPLGYMGMHVLFVLITLASLFIMLGFLYRVSSVVLFVGFTYVELIEAATYLNHYYYISLVAFIMIWLPANFDYSIDARLRPQIRRTMVPAWTINILRFQMAVVYIFAGLAKINTDWLLHAEPMKTWLPTKSHLPIIGQLMYKEWVAYLFSWFGAVYDLFIVFFLLNKRTRVVAYCVVVVFHLSTALFFPGIGMFPYVMITGSLIFFPAAVHEKLLGWLPFYKQRQGPAPASVYHYRNTQWIGYALAIYALIQVLVPLRFLLYPGQLFWNEEGYRFSWRVMLMEKAGTAYFTVKDKNDRSFYEVDNKAFLTPLQEKMMSTQPDMILKYAHYLAQVYKQKGIDDPKVYAAIYVTLNGAPSRLFIDSSVNLAAQPLSWRHYKWVLP